MSSELNKACDANDKLSVLRLLRSRAVINSINDRIGNSDSYDSDDDGYTALCCASESASADVVKALMRKGAKVNVWSGWGRSKQLPIHAACESDIDAVKKCELLLGETNNSINEPRTYPIYKLPISIAASKGNIEAVDLLLRRGADYNIRGDDRGPGPLQAAAERGHANVIELLLQHDPLIINTKSLYSGAWDLTVGTALHAAAYWDHVAAVKTLVAHPDCDVTMTDSEGQTALDLAKEENITEIIQILSNPKKHLSKTARRTIPVRYQRSSSVREGAKSNCAHASSCIKASTLEREITTLRSYLENVSIQAGNRDKSQSKRIHDLESRVRVLEDRSHSLKDKDLKEIKEELSGIKGEIETLKTKPSSATKPRGASNELTDLMLDKIAMKIGVDEQTSLGLELGFTFQDVQRTITEYSSKKDATLALLIRWRNQEKSGNRKQQVRTLQRIFKELDKMNLVRFLADFEK